MGQMGISSSDASKAPNVRLRGSIASDCFSFWWTIPFYVFRLDERVAAVQDEAHSLPARELNWIECTKSYAMRAQFAETWLEASPPLFLLRSSSTTSHSRFNSSAFSHCNKFGVSIALFWGCWPYSPQPWGSSLRSGCFRTSVQWAVLRQLELSFEQKIQLASNCQLFSSFQHVLALYRHFAPFGFLYWAVHVWMLPQHVDCMSRGWQLRSLTKCP